MISKRGEKYMVEAGKGEENRAAALEEKRGSGEIFSRAVLGGVVGGGWPRECFYVGAGPRQDPTPVKHEFLFLSFLRNEA
jgi:hypothetical protein